MVRHIGILLILAPALVAQIRVTPQPGPPAGQGAGYIVSFRPGTSQADRAASVRRAGAALRFNYRIIDAAAVRVPNVNALAALGRDMSVVRITPDRRVYAFQSAAAPPPGKGKPDKGGKNGQVVPEGVKRVVGRSTSNNGSGVGVAVLDTGIDLTHPDLSVAPQSHNGIDETKSCQDDNGHGTHVAGIIAAQDNKLGVVGVAPGATLYCVKVLDSTGSGADSTVIAGLDWVYEMTPASGYPPIRVVNMSLGRDKAEAIQRLYEAGVTVVAAAGNDPGKEVAEKVPAGFPEVIAVASTTATDGQNKCKRYSGTILADTASFFTTDGIGVTISAPGEKQEDIDRACRIRPVGILSLKLGGGTTRMYGTSMAAPHVACGRLHFRWRARRHSSSAQLFPIQLRTAANAVRIDRADAIQPVTIR